MQQQREAETRRKLLSSQRYQQQELITPTSTPMKETNNNSAQSLTTLEPDPANSQSYSLVSLVLLLNTYSMKYFILLLLVFCDVSGESKKNWLFIGVFQFST